MILTFSQQLKHPEFPGSGTNQRGQVTNSRTYGKSHHFGDTTKKTTTTHPLNNINNSYFHSSRPVTTTERYASQRDIVREQHTGREIGKKGFDRDPGALDLYAAHWAHMYV